MHDGASVVTSPQVRYLPEVVLEKVVLHAPHDVVPVDGDVGVSVSATLLVPEPHSVHQLVNHDTWLQPLI